VLDIAIQFQGQHNAHADLLTKTVKTLGGRPGEPKRPPTASSRSRR
jgi:hypothetical protein